MKTMMRVMTFLGLVVSLGLVAAIPGQAAVSDGFTITLTPTGERGVIIDTETIAMSGLVLGSTNYTGGVAGVVVIATGTIAPIEYTIQGALTGGWTLSNDGYANAQNKLAVHALFNTVAPNLAAFEGADITKNLLGAVAHVGGGMMDKFLGDGFMALFGAPLRREDHALQALNASAAIQQAHRRWMQERGAGGRPCRPLGIGVATGETVVGAYGTRNRMEYTALGHVVNLASRLCGAAEAGEILTTPFTRDEALRSAPADSGPGYLSFLSKGKMHFKNIQETIEVIAIAAEGTSYD